MSHVVLPRARGGLSRRLLVVLALGIAWSAVAGLGSDVEATTTPPAGAGLKVMIVGDSVPNGLMAFIRENSAPLGLEIIDAAQGGCGVRGDHLISPDGAPLKYGAGCPGIVPGLQAQGLAKDPDLVVWWDRWSLSDFVSSSGEHIRGGTPRFWRQRTNSLARHADRLTAGGAQLLFIATEPVGSGITTTCTTERCHPWRARLINEHDEYTVRWNGIMRDYARTRPDATFRSMNNVICLDANVPCDDVRKGLSARTDGVHFDRQKTRMARALVRRIADVLEL